MIGVEDIALVRHAGLELGKHFVLHLLQVVGQRDGHIDVAEEREAVAVFGRQEGGLVDFFPFLPAVAIELNLLLR